MTLRNILGRSMKHPQEESTNAVQKPDSTTFPVTGFHNFFGEIVFWSYERPAPGMRFQASLKVMLKKLLQQAFTCGTSM